MKFATVPNPKRGKWPFYYKEAGKSWVPAIFLQPERQGNGQLCCEAALKVAQPKAPLTVLFRVATTEAPLNMEMHTKITA
jgi:hypothetical protein